MNARLHDPHRAQRELLTGSDLLSGLPEAVVAPLIAASRLIRLAPRRCLQQTGDPIREVFLLFSGSVKRTVEMPGGAERVIELVESPQMLSIGEVFGANHYAATCTTITPALLVAIKLRTLREQLDLSPALSQRIISALARHQCAIEFDATVFHYGLTGTQRLLDYLLEQAGESADLAGESTVILKASKKVIAARIGMTPESLSRNLRELSEQGVIVVDGRRIHIQKAALLDTANGPSGQRLSFHRKRKGDASRGGGSLSAGGLVNLCGRLRLLSQRMALAWGAIAAGVAPRRARINLHAYEKEFVRHLDRLDRLALEPELAAHLDALQWLWPAYQTVLQHEDVAAAETIFALSEQLLALADGLTAEVSHLSGLPAANDVNTAGRNRMLSQRIGKFFLFRDWGDLQEQIARLLPPTYREFEGNLRILNTAGAATPEIAAQLLVVQQQWERFVRVLCPDLAHSNKDKHARLVLTEGDRLLRSVDTTVKLFERLANSGEMPSPSPEIDA